jgi:hypothetical protein
MSPGTRARDDGSVHRCDQTRQVQACSRSRQGASVNAGTLGRWVWCQDRVCAGSSSEAPVVESGPPRQLSPHELRRVRSCHQRPCRVSPWGIRSGASGRAHRSGPARGRRCGAGRDRSGRAARSPAPGECCPGKLSRRGG